MIRQLLSAVICIVALAGCAPGLPKGVSSAKLETALDDKVGDPNTCVLIGKAGSGAEVYRYGTHVVCGQAWPSCQDANLMTATALLPVVARAGSHSNLSCPTNPDGSRSVGWASGPVDGHPDLVFVAVMEGTTTPPGMVVAEHISSALRTAGF